MTRALVLAVSLFASPMARGCTCAWSVLDVESARAAQHVFIFQLMSAEFTSEGDGSVIYEGASGTVRVIESLRGDGAQFRSLTFNTSICCGSRLDVGHYYAAFTSEDGPSFPAGGGSIVNITFEYSESSEYPHSEHGIVTKLEALLRGDLNFEGVLPGQIGQGVSNVPLPPRPCSTSADRAPES